MSNTNHHIVAMSGASGFVGTHLQEEMRARGWRIIELKRHDFTADPQELAARMEGADVVINLAGAPIIGRWSEEYKKILRESRITVTRSLISACALLPQKPQVLISCSAVGYYDSAGTHTEKEYTPAGNFLGELTRDWEREALAAEALSIRTVIFRFGIVLGRKGGALQKMVMPFKLGLGATIGDGSQAVSWIHIHDLWCAYITAIERQAYAGIYNLTSPEPATNKQLSRALGKALHRPVCLSIPAWVLRLRFGEGAQVLTSGQRVVPERLLAAGFAFRFREIEAAVTDCVS